MSSKMNCAKPYLIYTMQLDLSPLYELSPSLQACLISKAPSMHYILALFVFFLTVGMPSQGFQKFSLY